MLLELRQYYVAFVLGLIFFYFKFYILGALVMLVAWCIFEEPADFAAEDEEFWTIPIYEPIFTSEIKPFLAELHSFRKNDIYIRQKLYAEAAFDYIIELRKEEFAERFDFIENSFEKRLVNHRRAMKKIFVSKNKNLFY